MSISAFARLGALLILCACSRQELAYMGQRAVVTKRDLVQNVTVAGKLEAARASTIIAAYKGYIRKIFVGVGQKVKKDEPLVSISSNLDDAAGFFPMRAPFSGKITQIPAREGEFVSDSAREDKFLMILEDTSHFELKVEVPELDLPKISLGQAAKIRLASLPGKEFPGEVSVISLSPKVNQGQHWGDDTQSRYIVGVKMKDNSDDFRSGMSAVVDIQTAEKKSVLTLPGEFLTEREGNEAVKLADGSYRKIEIGLRTDEAFEVSGGLKEGDTVIMDSLGGQSENAR